MEMCFVAPVATCRCRAGVPTCDGRSFGIRSSVVQFMRGLFLCVVLAVVSAWDAVAEAAEHSARLVYMRTGEATVCTDEEGLRSAVGKRLGYDPFVLYSPMTIVVEVHPRASGGFEAELRISGPGDITIGQRSLASPSHDCRELVDALALNLSLAIDPVKAMHPSPSVPADEAPAAPPPPAEAPPPTLAPVVVAADRGDARATTWRPESLIFLSAYGSAGQAPALTAGAILASQWRWRSLSLGVEARADWPASRAVAAQGSIRSHSVSGWLVLCYYRGWFGGCAVAGIGEVFAESLAIGSPASDSAPYLAAGPRAVATFPVGR